MTDQRGDAPRSLIGVPLWLRPSKPKRKASSLPWEHELSAPVAKWFMAKRMKVYAEVMHPEAHSGVGFKRLNSKWVKVLGATPGARIDLVCIRWISLRPTRVATVELKRVLSKQVLEQAVRNVPSANESWVAVFRSHPAGLAAAREAGIGVLRVSLSGEVELVAVPRIRRNCKGAISLARKAKRTSDGTVGGVATRTIKMVELQKNSDPGVVLLQVRRLWQRSRIKHRTWEAAFKALDPCYVSPDSMRHALKKLVLRRRYAGVKCAGYWAFSCKCVECEKAQSRYAAGASTHRSETTFE